MKRFFVLAAVLAVIIVPIVTYTRLTSDNPPAITYGPKTEEGLLSGTGISLIRKGTHILEIDGTPTYFVSSNKVELERYEGQNVKLIGRVDPNVSPDYLPLFTVDELVPLDEQETTEEWSVPTLGITLDAPATWDATLASGILMFERSGDPTPLLVVKKHTGALPAGDIIRVAGKSGIRLHDGNDQKVFVAGMSGAILFDFTPHGDSDIEKLQGDFQRVLNSVHFALKASSSSIATGTGGVVCGGAAGILCPTGFFCEIRDAVTNEGRCRKP